MDPKSLVVSSASQTSVEEAEIHFSEATVNRLFGGPLAPLHRARNFEPFSDPYEVFERVFGSPVFPKVACSADYGAESGILNASVDNGKDRMPALLPPSSHHSGWEGSAYKHADGLTTVFISSRVIRDRKITRTETVHVDPNSGKTVSEVTVEGEDLENTPEEDDGPIGGNACEWIVCHRTQEQVDKENVPSPPSAKVALPLCSDLRCVYEEFLEEFYHWNTNLYSTCTGVMGCSDEEGTST
jgi:hypothetical protein